MNSSEATRLGTQAAQILAQLGQCKIGPGLTDAEFSRIEHEYGIEFAGDHRAFLAAGLPLNTPIPEVEGVFHTHARLWPDWREGTPEELRKALAWPTDGVLFDVDENTYWHDSWGARPDDQAEALRVAEAHLANVPRLIPIYGHRYLPSGRAMSGHPVLSMYQTDIIYYGIDLVDYIHNEFGGAELDRTDPRWPPQATVPFWRDFL